MAVTIAVIGGTGVYDPEILSDLREEQLSTPYGQVQLKIGSYQGREVAFMTRHGADHSVPPHLVNYRANIAALRQLGVKSIFATAAVGSLNMDFAPRHFVLVDQFLDFTKGRPSTFVEQGVVHLDMTEPYCPELRQVLLRAARELELPCHPAGTYVCTEGPRFETPAEIKMFKMLGGDLVGMTSVPEVVLAREAEICYATVAMVTNYAAGISSSKLSHQEVVEIMTDNGANLRRLLMRAISLLPPERDCACHHALAEPVAVPEKNN
ncbi:MAG: S-methyl-5'-thioadenosine phosphorylase [Bacillota bacterium]|uniref:S-methyl-5'-thioadenosine phosphorylase n=1 Tax=Desulfurispora thermophila TaxID=265470 RepID=UPI0003790F41|nr:S-methyl-5'-thioadenosine phosphorylase [Desulfurispora thermophila]